MFGTIGWSDATSVMLAAAATHADVSSTFIMQSGVGLIIFCALEMSPRRLPVAAHTLRVGPGPGVVLFLNADSAGSIYNTGRLQSTSDPGPF